MTPTFWIAALLAATPAPAPASHASSNDTWYVVRIGGATVGTASESLVHGATETVFRAHMNVRFTRLGTPISMMVLTEEVSDPDDGRLRRSRMESSLSNSSSTAVLEGDTLRYESRVGGTSDTRAIPWKAGAGSEAQGADGLRAWVGGASPETTMTIFDISEGGYREQRFVRGARGSDGLLQVDEYDDKAATPSSTIWFDGDGAAVRTLVKQLGVEIMIEKIDAADVDKIEIEPDFDIIRQSMVDCTGFPRPAERVKDVTLRLEFAGLPPATPMTGPNQQELSRDGHAVELRLTRETSVKMTEDGKNLEPFLRPDRFVQSSDPTLRAVADSIRTATRDDGWKLARDVAAWVNGYIVHKGMEHGYASALDVYRTRSGDCTEHSLLTVALLRASGIPARPVVGLAYSEADGAFVGHMWTEAYVGQWRSLDALNLAMDPIHLRIHAPQSSESLGERDLLRAYGAVAGVDVSAIDYHFE